MVDNLDCTAEVKDLIKLSIPNKPEYVSVVRLTSSAIASRLYFDIEEIEDIKVAVAEACTNILENVSKEVDKNIDIEFEIYENKLCISVKIHLEKNNQEQGQNNHEDNIVEKGLGILILESLMDNVELISYNGVVEEIKMIKHIKDDAR